MAIQSQPSRISEPFAGTGTKNVIPATNATPSASQAASWASGFPPECSQPISAGGCPVPRNDMNGVLNWLSQDFSFRQDGGVWAWSALADYDTQRVVRGSDGLLYMSVAQSGPGVAAGAQDPTADTAHDYWISPKVPMMPADDSSDSAASTAWVYTWNNSNTVPATLYVDPVNGDDSNDGTTSATAKKTISGVLAVIGDKSKTVAANIDIYLAAGTYTESLTVSLRTAVSYHGVDGVIVPGITTLSSQRIDLYGTITLTGSLITHTYGLTVLHNGLTLKWNNVSKAYALNAYAFGIIRIFSGNSVSFEFTNCTFSTATVYANNYGYIFLAGTETWSGTVTGKRYSLITCSQATGIGSANTIPGTVAGTADSLSVYN